MTRRLHLLAAALGLSLASIACGSPPAPNAGPKAEPTREFDAHEDEILRDLAAVDRRIARRAHVTPSESDIHRVTMTALLHEDPSLAVVDGAIDPFSFDARARGLDGAAKKIASLPAAASCASERELLERLVAAEQARLEEERALPRSASALVRGIVDTWRAPKTLRDAAEVDRWLGRRLDELRERLEAPGAAAESLDVVRARELDDALDSLERLVSAPGYTRTMQALVRVREALEAAASRPAATTQSDWTRVALRARAHLGTVASREELARGLVEAEVALRTRAVEALAAADIAKDAVETSLEKRVFVSGPCIDAVPGSPVRSMSAPPEREPACHLRHLLATADDDTARALAWAAMHDHVVVALWALDVAHGDSTIAGTEGHHQLLVPVLPGTRARYERIALARPVAAIGAGEAARILMRGDVRANAGAWSSIGDVPLDVAAREHVAALRGLTGATRLRVESANGYAHRSILDVTPPITLR